MVNAVLPDDGTRQAVLDSLGVNEALSQTAELPLAVPDRSYNANTLFGQATTHLPGHVATVNTGDLRTVLAPFALRGFAEGFARSAGDIGALAMVELADHSILVSAGANRNEVFHYSKEGGRSTLDRQVTPLFTLDVPVLDMAMDSVGQLWVMTGSELLQVDASSGSILRRMSGPAQDPLTHALAIQPGTGDIYVSSGNGIEIFRPNESNPARAWQHFSNQRVGDLAFGPDARLWGVRWSGSDITAAQPKGTTDIVSFPLSGRTAGRAELEFRLNGVIDSISFGAAGTALEGLLLASSNLQQRPVVLGASELPHQSSVWAIELQSRRLLQLASGGTQGESIIATADGRILVAQTGHIDEIAPIHAPQVVAVSVPDGALLPLPVGQIAVVFDQAMWLGSDADANADISSVLNPENFTLTALGGLNNNPAGAVIVPHSVRWDAASKTAYLSIEGLPAGSYQLDISNNLRSATEQRMAQAYLSTFTAVLDMSSQVQLAFTNTRGNRATGEVSYDVSLTNIGTDDLKGPLMLLLDPGRYFGHAIEGAGQGGAYQSDLWILDLSAALAAQGGRFAVGSTIANQTVTVVPASRFGTRAGSADLVKFNLGHGVYAMPQENLPPSVSVAMASVDSDGVTRTVTGAATFAAATVGQAWTGLLDALDSDGTRFYWQLVQAPAGVTLTPPADFTVADDGYHSVATLRWTPNARDLADTEIVVRVQDSRGGVATRRFHLPVIGGNYAPTIDTVTDITLTEGQALSLPLTAADANGDALTVTVRNLPAGAVFDAGTGLLSWVPGYDQAGVYQNVSIVVSDGKTTVSKSFTLTVEQGYAKPVLATVAAQTLREGDHYALQLAGSVPGGLTQADGTVITLEYSARWLPGGATLNRDTGWFAWTPGYSQHGTQRVPITVTATYTSLDGSVETTSVTQALVLTVLNANGAPLFDAAETWNLLEGSPLRISVFAFDPDNPDFEPKIRLRTGADAVGPETTAPTVSYQVDGLPAGASFDADTLEIVWTPGYAQAGTYTVTVTATDDGDGTATPGVSQIVLPIVVSDANRAPDIGDISHAFVDKGAVLEIPVSAVDIDGNPVQLSFIGLPAFASYAQNEAPSGGAQNPSGVGAASGVLRFAPGADSRGDYTITVVAQDNGSGNLNQVLTQAKSFVLTVRSATEAPVFSLPRQVVAVVGQAFNLALAVRDRDQDALTFSSSGLPIGATLTPQTPYGQAVLSWTPTATDIGTRDIDITVTDSGLGPVGDGHVTIANPVPNGVTQTVRVVVRASNATPELLGLQVNGLQVADSGDATVAVPLNATEGVPLTLELFGRDSDTDLLSWSVANLPSGMVLEVPSAGDNNGSGGHAILRWTPGQFAAQSDNLGGGQAGTYRFTVKASDGAAEMLRTIEINVANVNQTPVILPMPLQLVTEGNALGFTLRTADADNDLVRSSLVYDENTPSGVVFDGDSGYFEWTPSLDVVNNATASSQPFTFTFRATDGVAIATQTVQVRVFDQNRTPRLSVANHAVVIGQTLSLPVHLSLPPLPLGEGWGEGGIHAWDDDGQAQTQALAITFTGLPEGASYNAATQQLLWTPGPGQTGDFVFSAHASDGKNSTSSTFTVRVVADAAANSPKILLETTPSTPALPGQTVVATVRADAWSGIATIAVEVRGAGLGSNQWQTMALDSAGRLRLIPTQPGLVELRITAVDRDGFSSTETRLIRVKDPADTQAPALAWQGALLGATAFGQPVDVTAPISLQAMLQEQQLMGYQLEIAPADSGAWHTLAEQSSAASGVNQYLDLTTLDPAAFANGVYQLRLRAWDLAGRTTEISTRLIIDSANKTLATISVTDASFTLDGHTFALTRSLVSGAAGSSQSDWGNWQLAALDTQLTTDQLTTTASGVIAPWMEGARVWLQVPDSLSANNAALRYFSFTLGTTSQRLGSEAGAPQVWSPVFSSSQGWTLEAHSNSSDDAGELLQRQGQRLYSQTTGLPWVPTRYTLTAPDGTHYSLDASGKLTAVRFTDGKQWLVSDAGIAAVTGDATDRVDFIRNAQGRIERITGLVTPSPFTGEGGGEGALAPTSIAYRYDAQNRLILARELGANTVGTSYGYDNAGVPFADTITANLGTAANWLGNSTANQWAGALQEGVTTTVAFTVRESELAATVKVPGAQGALIVAIEAQLADPQATLEVTGATVLGSTTLNGKQTILVRVTEAGLKLIRLIGTGTSSVRVEIAGDLNRDGKIDGTDSASLADALTQGGSQADLNGDGQLNATDRQILFANTGWRANLAPLENPLSPVAGEGQGEGAIPLKTHTDLATRTSLAAKAQDPEGDPILWRVLSATHGTARLSSDGTSLLFMPEAGYAGQATITLQADDGFTAAAPIELGVNVSGAKLLAIRLLSIPSLSTGQSAAIKAIADFADEQGVNVSVDGRYLTVTSADLAALGSVNGSPIQVDDSRDLIRATANGPALIIVTRTNTDGSTVRAVASLNARQAMPSVELSEDELSALSDEEYEAYLGELEGAGHDEPLLVQPDVYPGTLTLTPNGTRQLKVHLLDPDTGEQTDISQAQPTAHSATRYYSSDETVATVSATGVITAIKTGRVTLSVVHLTTPVITSYVYGTDAQGLETITPVETLGETSLIGQSDITLNVDIAQLTDNDDATAAPQRISISAAQGGAVSAATGETVLIGAGALAQDTQIGIRRIDVDNLLAETGMAAPLPDLLQAVGAFHLDLGDQHTRAPVQLAIPLQSNSGAQAGDEVLFLRRSTVIDIDGNQQDAWWVLDNGFVGEDGVARTASPPYVGMSAGGDILVVTSRTINPQTGAVTVKAINIDVYALMIGGMVWAAGGPLGGIAAGLMTSVLLSSGSPVYALTWTEAGAYQVQQVQRDIDSSGNQQLTIALPQNGSSTAGAPRVTSMEMLNGKLRLHLSHVMAANQQQIPTKLKVWISPTTLTIDEQGNASSEPGSSNPGADAWDDAEEKRDGMRLWKKLVEQSVTAATTYIDLDIPAGVALSLHNITLQRMLTGQGTDGNPITYTNGAPVSVAVEGQSDFGVVTQARVVQLIENGVIVNELPYLDANGQPITAAGGKTDQLAFSIDNRLMFIAGNQGQIHVMDTALKKLVHTFTVEGSRDNISSLAVSGKWLYVAEGGRFASNNGTHRLMRVNIDQESADFLKSWQISLPAEVSDVNAPCGYNDLAIVQGTHSYLAVTASKVGLGIAQFTPTQDSGSVFILDLNELTTDTNGQLRAIGDAFRLVTFPARQGKGPQYIAPAGIKDNQLRFMLADAFDYNAGFAAVTVSLGADGKMQAVAVKQIGMSGLTPGQHASTRYDNKYQLNIQRAQAPVFAVVAGVEYALVADYFFDFLDPAYFLGVLADKQAGGKVGIIKNPFSATPEYLGSTTPIGDASINALTLGGSGADQVLWADIRNWPSHDGQAALPNGLLVWKLSELIAAAERNSLASRGGTRPLPIDREVNGAQTVPVATPDKYNLSETASFTSGWIFGMARSQVLKSVLTAEADTVLRYGDVARIDLIKFIKEEFSQFAAVTNENFKGFNADSIKVELGTLAQNEDKKIISAVRDETLVAIGAATKSSYAEGNVNDTGIVFIAPTITDEMVRSLREGTNLDKETITLHLKGICWFPSKIDPGFSSNFDPGFGCPV